MDPSRPLATERQALDERLGQAACAHALLDCLDIVRDAPELDGFFGEVGNYECGARVSIARLAYRAGIDQIRGAVFDG